MKRLSNLLIVLLMAAFVLPQTADAQLLKKLKERAKERVEEKIEEKAEKAVDDAVDGAMEGAEDAAISAFERKTQPKELDLGENADGPADAPYVRYRQTTSMDLGSMGQIARMMGTELEHQTETVSITTDRQRTDSDESSTIMDLRDGRFIMLDHAKKQYTVWSFDEMADRMDEAMASMKEQADEAATADMAQSDVETDMSFDVSVDRTGRTDMVNGSSAEQMLVTMKTEFDVRAADDSGEEGRMRGTTYALIDTWVSRDVAGIETIRALQEAAGRQMGSTFMDTDATASLGAMGMDVSELMEEASKEVQGLDGLPVRSTTHVILVPEGQELDVEAALNPPAADEGQDAAAMAQAMAAMQGAEGETGGPTQQVTLMRSVTQISDLETTPIPDDHFDIPADYEQVDLF